MDPSEKITLIQQIAKRLASHEWAVIDLTLRQFNLPWSEIWNGNGKESYIIEMIEDADEKSLLQLAQHLRLIKPTIQFPPNEIQRLVDLIEQQRALMIDVATDKKSIKKVNNEYVQRRKEIKIKLNKLGLEDPNPFPDLWNWHQQWTKEKTLSTYSSRRAYVTKLYQPLIDTLLILIENSQGFQITPTGWAKVDRNMEEVADALANASNEENFQSVGLLCRETMISLAQAVYDPSYPSLDGVTPSETDAKRMLESYIAHELAGKKNEELRQFTKKAYNLAVSLQHRRTATFRDAALSAEATRALVNIIAILAGRREPNVTNDSEHDDLPVSNEDSIPF